jgi:tetratricopeptide (TPR) repeat protein
VLAPSTWARADDRPWARGVPAETQEQARAIYRQGNREFAQKAYATALEKYRRAAQLWAHPAIEFNLAQCLVRLDRPVEAHHYFVQSLRHGEPPLGAFYQRAIEERQRLEAQLSWLEVTCDEPGAIVSLDGKTLFTAPGSAKRLLRPGKHQVLASKTGYVTAAQNKLLLPRTRTKMELRLKMEQVLQRRWAIWKPWAVVGSGLLLAGAGVLFQVLGQRRYDEFGDDLTAECPSGCLPEDVPQDTRDLRSSGEAMSGVAVGLFSLGSAVALAGAVLAIINQPRALEESSAVLPIAGRRSAGLTLRGRF